ncbi:fumarylacetoacetate hydrolase family protein [Streptomyces viridiviolaceus]
MTAARWYLTSCRLDREHAAIRRTDGSLVIPDVLRKYEGLAQALDDWDTFVPTLRDLDPSTLAPVTDAVETLSVRHPRKLLCVGANYRDHIAEMGGGEPPEGVTPFFFLVPATTTLTGDGDPVLIPSDPALRIDWEAELAVVIGRGGRDITETDALSHVAGYACFNDITARGLLRRPSPLAEPFTWDWTGAKGQDTFCPLGAVTPVWELPDPGDLRIRCVVNGTVKQDSHTGQFIAGVPALIAAASRGRTLEPGDIIATGTPAGVGQSRGEQLHDGDEVRVEITGLAPLTNPIRFRDTDRR